MPEPMSEASGITATQPSSSSCLARIGIVAAVGHHLEALGDERLRRRERLGHVGIERLRVPEHLELHQRVPVEELAREAQRAHRVLARCSSPAVLGRIV